APAFESIDPETIRQQGETVQLSSDEVRRQRVDKLLSDAILYMEAGRYATAVEIYSNALLIDPNNPAAKDGLHKATIAAHGAEGDLSMKQVDEDRAMIRNFIERSKRLPEGADARGIKPYRFSVPEIAEESSQEKEKGVIEKILESPVSLEFEDIHISEIAAFVSDSWEVNIVIDSRAVEPPKQAQPQQAAAAAPGGPPGMPGAFPPPGGAAPFPGGGAPQPAPQFGGMQGAGNRPGQPGAMGGAQAGMPGATDAVYGVKSSGVVPYVNLKNVSLAEGLQALLRPLGLDYAVQPGFIWISKPEIIRRESFEKLVTRYYELRNAGSETLYKLVLRNRFGGVGGRMGGMGGGMMGGGMGDVTAISNISDLFSSISDLMVGETPSQIMTMGLQSTGTGATANRNQAYGGGGYGAAQGGAGLGGTASGTGSFGIGTDILSILERLVPQVFEPYTEELLSDMIYNPANNLLIVKNTPSNLDTFEKQLAEIDVTPKQVSIEAKFLTIRLEDLKKIGFKWDATISDLNNRDRETTELAQQPYYYDINGDGVDETVPFYMRPDGSRVIRNTVSDAAINSLTNPTSAVSPTFSILGNIIDNSDGDKLALTFDYLDSLEESELLSAPRVTTMNRKPAVVADFSTEYFISAVNTQILTLGSGFSGNTSSNFVQNVIPTSYNFGIALSVTPQIRDNDQVRLWLNPEVRTKTGQKSFEQKQVISGQEISNEIVLPTTSWQAVWTNVIVHDGDTLVLGGLVQDQTSKGTQKMPYLADIPVIGFFFKGNKRESKQSSLLIFVTPDIIDSTGARFFDIAGDKPAY
ncbi:MAG TPA: hypothetical protein PL005_14755, partial [Candidatus Hydrogenedentes bacterium]|nr:hypothetical protein [Candidatus Hydrogenedentota bacterium]